MSTTTTTTIERADRPGPALPVDVGERLRAFAEASRAESTRRAYATSWRFFREWCEDHGYPPLPASPQAVAHYLAHLAGRYATSTIGRTLAAIAFVHEGHGIEPGDVPTRRKEVRVVWEGIRRTFRERPREAAPLLVDDLRDVCRTLGDHPRDVRDRAMLLIGFAGALRVSELCGLDVGDLTEVPDGLLVAIRWSKTDQTGEGDEVGVSFGSDPRTCPVRAWRAWLDVSGIEDGPAWRAVVGRDGRIADGRLTTRSASRMVKARVAQAGLDASKFSSHSMRAGLATSAAIARVPVHSIQRQTRHASLAMLLKYVRIAEAFDENAASQVGL